MTERDQYIAVEQEKGRKESSALHIRVKDQRGSYSSVTFMSVWVGLSSRCIQQVLTWLKTITPALNASLATKDARMDPRCSSVTWAKLERW